MVCDEEVAVIEAALAVDRLFWPPNATAAIEKIGEVMHAFQNLHTAALALERKRQTPVVDL